MREVDRNPRQYRELLRSGRWFKALPEAFQDRLLDAGVRKTFAPGERLFSRGDPPSGLFAAIDGSVRVTATTEAGKEAILTLVEPPFWFGEIAVFDGLPRTHDAIAESEATVLHVPQSAIDAILRDEPRWWRDLALLVTAKLRLAFLVMEEAAIHPIPTRLARRLVTMAEAHGELEDRSKRVLDVPQEQLAMMLATSRQTVNQVLKDLEARGLVRLSYGRIEIVDLEGLRKAARPDDPDRP